MDMPNKPGDSGDQKPSVGGPDPVSPPTSGPALPGDNKLPTDEPADKPSPSMPPSGPVPDEPTDKPAVPTTGGVDEPVKKPI